MRGKVPVFGALMLIGRITPAYAGKSDCLILHRIGTWDHPRLCGEKSADAARHPSRTRITPAYAGKRPGSQHT